MIRLIKQTTPERDSRDLDDLVVHPHAEIDFADAKARLGGKKLSAQRSKKGKNL